MNVALAVLAALAALWGVRDLRRRLPPSWPRQRSETTAGESTAGDLPSLARIVATASRAGDVHWQLRPVLREIATAALRQRGVELDDDTAAARAVLKPDTWDLVRPDRPRPDDTFAPGLTSETLRAVLDDLGRLLA